jgi:Ion channel
MGKGNDMRRIPRGEAVLPLLTVALFVLMFVTWPLVEIGVVRRPLLGMVLLIAMLSGLFALGVDARFAPPVVALGLSVFCLQVATLVRPSGTLGLLNTVAASLLVLSLAGLLLRGVMRSGPVTPNRIVGAVAVYLLVALLFALLFDLLDRVAPGAFTLDPEPLPSTPAGARFFYLSVITLTSLGLGSVAPVHPFARALVLVEAVVGQFYMTVLMARLVSLEVARRLEKSGP